MNVLLPMFMNRLLCQTNWVGGTNFRPTGVSKSTSRDNLVALFGVPLTEAAASLGVSTTIIKRLCRRHDIPR